MSNHKYSRMGSLGNNVMDRFALAAPPCVVRAAGHALFWPIACSQYIMTKLGIFQWFSEVYISEKSGGRIILGGLPWPEATRQALLKDEHVTAVINLVSEKSFPFKVEKRLDIPLEDFAHPKTTDVAPALEFLDEAIKEGRTVYVHCRAGKGRSATVAMCWLVSRLGMTPESAQEFLERKRPQILNNLYSRDVVREFFKNRRISK